MENITSHGEQTQFGYSAEARTPGKPINLIDGTTITEKWTPIYATPLELDVPAGVASTSEELRKHGLLSYGSVMAASWNFLGYINDPSLEIRLIRHKLTTTWKSEEEGIVEMPPLTLPIRPETKPRE